MTDDGLKNAPMDDLSDDVTVAADSDLVEQIRRRAEALRTADVPADETTIPGKPISVDADVSSPDVLDDDVTIAAPPRTTAANSTVLRTPSTEAPAAETRSAEAPAVQSAPSEASASVQTTRVAPDPKPIAAPFVSPFRDDGVSLIDEQDAPEGEQSWEPPSRFDTEVVAPPRKVGRPWKFYAVICVVAAVSALISALVVLALVGS